MSVGFVGRVVVCCFSQKKHSYSPTILKASFYFWCSFSILVLKHRYFFEKLKSYYVMGSWLVKGLWFVLFHLYPLVYYSEAVMCM